MLTKPTTLRAARLAKGLPLAKVAAGAGISAGALSRIERGERQPKARTLRRILGALGFEHAETILAQFEAKAP